MLEKIIRNQATVGLLCLRLTTGIIFLAHGREKLTPRFGGQESVEHRRLYTDGDVLSSGHGYSGRSGRILWRAFFGYWFILPRSECCNHYYHDWCDCHRSLEKWIFLSQQGFEYNFALIGGFMYPVWRSRNTLWTVFCFPGKMAFCQRPFPLSCGNLLWNKVLKTTLLKHF